MKPGSLLGPYEIVAPLGAGGMGEVYRARDTRLERDVALKVLAAGAVADDTARARLMREARLASKLSHPHICTIYDVGEDRPSAGSGQGACYIAMELIEGQTLADRLRAGALPFGDVVRYGRQLAGALAHAHARGVLHRDFKSANVVATPDGQLKVLDFGLAKRLASDAPADDPSAGSGSSRAKSRDETTMSRQTLTEAGAVAGTLAYMAPEQLRGQAADARSDIWALGVVLYELVAGHRPFQGKTAFELSSAILNQPAPTVPASVPAPLAAVIDRCLSKEPGERYQRADEVSAGLEVAATGQAVASPSPTRRRRRPSRGLVATASGIVLVTVVAALAVALDVGGIRSRLTGTGALGLLDSVRGGPERAAPVIRLAVLPFDNLTGDPEQEYFSDGLTQEMISQLGRLGPQSLEVIGSTSVMRYKRTDTPVDQIGRELDVGHVLEGSARREGSRVRITVELIEVASQTQRWTENYDRDMSGILALQSDVAQKVAKAIALRLLPAEQARLAGAPSVNAEAYDAVLKGRYHWGRLTAQEFDTAQRYFELALAEDPSYAPAYAGLAVVWAGRQQMGIMPATDAAPKWRAAALRALALDDRSAAGHDALAGYLTWHEWDLAGAEPLHRKVIELEPNNATNQVYYAHFLAITGRLEAAVIHSELAVRLDPFNELVLGMHAAVLNFVDRYEEAVAAARKALSLQPDSPIANSHLELALFMLGRHDEIMTRRRQRLAEDPERLAALERGHAESGLKDALRRDADVRAARYEKSPTRTGTVSLAQQYLMAGDKDKAMLWLEKAYENREGNLLYIGRPVWNPLRPDPRFLDLLRRLNLPVAPRK